MQVDRLFKIVYTLLHKKTVTAKELSDEFGVSSRTIYRDVEILSGAGIPIYMTKGKGGGIRLLDHFVLNKSVLSEEEQTEILSALEGLGAADYPDVDSVLSKLSTLFKKDRQNWIEVDFSGWSDHKERFNLIKTGILNKKTVRFLYYSSYGEKTSREVEPLQLCFKEKTWYLKAFCLDKQGIRIFKLKRIKNLQLTDTSFDRVLSEEIQEPPEKAYNKNFVTVILNIDSSQAYRVYDEFEEGQVHKNEDESFTVITGYYEDEWVYGYILSYGFYAEVIQPPHIRELIKNRLQKALDQYTGIKL